MATERTDIYDELYSKTLLENSVIRTHNCFLLIKPTTTNVVALVVM